MHLKIECSPSMSVKHIAVTNLQIVRVQFMAYIYITIMSRQKHSHHERLTNDFGLSE